jgi:hypothetical protein
MSKFELSLASDYVPDWTLVDAIRELFQNALDQEVQVPDNKASWSYDNGTFKISNKTSTLETKSLLLGTTTKEGDDRTIGQFGEGYKIATLVLLRNAKQVTIYNYGLREVWRPRFVKSRRFGAEILTFFVDKKYPWKQVPDNDLTIEVTGLTDEEWFEQIVPANLHLQSDVKIEESNEYGEALSATKHAGLVFVNGLYVCKYDPYKFGYNFKPGNLKLDRDRKLASDFDLRWLASKFWMNNPRVIEFVEQDLADVSYLSDMSWYSSSINISNEAFERFRLVHGPRAVPVTSQEEADKVPAGYKAVIVSSNYKNLITRSSAYEEPEDDSIDPLDKLQQWFESIEDNLTEEQSEQFNEIMEELRL